MAKTSKIEWTDSTFNPWIGCTKVSTATCGGGGCDNCYAEVSTPARTQHVTWGPGQPRVRTSPGNWKAPERWNRQPFFQCAMCGRRGTDNELSKSHPDDTHVCFQYLQPARRRVFCASLADVFDNEVDPQWRADLFDLIRRTPSLDWLLLTKRIGNVRKMVQDLAEATVGAGSLNLWLTQWAFAAQAPANVWLGATIVNQPEADRDIPKLLAVPARVRFLSMEPLLGPVDIRKFMWPVHPRWPAPYRSPAEAITAGAEVTYHRQALLGAHVPLVTWVIVGGESGPGARPMHPDWAHSLRDQCAAAGAPFLFKQWGEWAPDMGLAYVQTPAQLQAAKAMKFHQFPDGTRMYRIGKEAAGRLLDGRTWDGYPA
jgi:protein gp37